MLTLMRSSTQTSAQQRLQGALTSYTESLKALPYYSQCLPELHPPPSDPSTSPCDSPEPPATTSTTTPNWLRNNGCAATVAQFQAAAAGWANRWIPPSYVTTAEVTNVEFWTPSAPGSASMGTFTTTCPAGGDLGAIRLTGRVVLSDGGSSTGQVVIRDPRP
jgi:hypothetical protein